MRIVSTARKALKRIVLGPMDFPQQCPIGMRDPQSEVSVWLHGLDAPRDVTHTHLMACAAPFTIGIGLERERNAVINESTRLSLAFHERGEGQRLLGTIGLQLSSVVFVGSQSLCLFRPTSWKNYCLPPPRLWARHLQYAWLRRRDRTPNMPLAAREAHSMFVFYICPRPVVLVSVTDGKASNIFPMNLMGPRGNEYFSFALNSATPATALVERAGRIALSSVPVEQTSVAFELGKNHKKECVDWNQLPFPMTVSSTIGLPVPQFSLRVREMKIEIVRKAGSHMLFVARTLHDECWADGLQFFVVHGIYQAWRQRKLALQTLRPCSS